MVFNPNGTGEVRAKNYRRPSEEEIIKMNKAFGETVCSNCMGEELDNHELDAIKDNETARWTAYQRCKSKGLCKA